MQVKLKRKFECFKEKEGTTNKMIDDEDKANQSRAEETDIKLMFEKYGIMTYAMLDKAKENLYLDMRGENLTLNERLKQKQEIDEYFETLPAKVRKNYKDNKQLFYEQIMSGDYSQLIEDNILTQEQAKNYSTIINKDKETINNLQNQINALKQKYENIGEVKNGNQTIN